MKAFAKSLFLLVLLCITVVAVPVSAQSDCFDDAQDAFDDGDYEEAIELFSCAIEDDFENYEAYLGRANSYLLTGSLAVQTIIDYNYVLNNDAGAIDDLIDDVSDDIDDDPEAVEPYIIRAFASYQIEDYEGVLDDTDVIIDLDDEVAVAYLLRATANQYLGDTRDVEDDLETAFDIDPDNAAMYEVIGLAFLETGEYELAVENYSGAIDQIDNDAYYYLQRGWASFFAGDPDGAIDDFDEAINLDEAYASAYYRRAVVEIALDELEAAASDLNIYSELLLDGDDLDPAELEAGDSDEFLMEVGFFYAYQFEAEEGQTINITVESSDGTDPLIALIDPNGDGLSANDDVDFSGGDYNSEISDVEATEDGTYIVLIFHSYAAQVEGDVEISLEVD